MGIQTPITIVKAIENIQSNDFVLPAIQREFVWSSEQVEKLFDSLMRGYPIGSFLFWQIRADSFKDFQFYRFMDRYHERSLRHNEPIELVGEKPRTAILDGQQRLTALNIGLKGWYAEKLPYYRWNNEKAYPKKQLYLNLLTRPDKENEMAYDFRMLDDSDAQQKDDKSFWFKVGDILQFKSMQDVFKYCVKNGLVSQDLEYPSDTLVRLWQVIIQEPVISHFLEEEKDLDKVLNIFIRVNSGGTTLSYSDMLLSIATAQWKKLDARNEIYDLVEDLNNLTEEKYDFSKDFILKASLILTDIKAIEFKVGSFNRDNMLTIEEQWKNIAEALQMTTKLLADWGYNRDTLVSNYAVIPLAYYIFKKGCPTSFLTSSGYSSDREKMRRWLMKALLKQTFSGQPDSVLRPIRQIIAENSASFPEEEIYSGLSRTAKSMSFDEAQIDALLDYKYGKSVTFTILSMLYPWLKYDQHFHADHIFPRSQFTPRRLRKHNIPEDQRDRWLDHKDDLANLQLLQGKQNLNKSDNEFEDWLCKEAPEPADLQVYKELHMIPDVDLSFENFPEFLDKRTSIIKTKLTELLGH